MYAGKDTPELRDVVLGRNFVLESEELPWMIDRIRRYESFLHTGKIFSGVRSGIVRTIESHSEHVEFSLDWDIRKTLDQQYEGEGRSQIRLSDMIVYNGTPSLCYTSTTSEYVKQIRPALGIAVVGCFDHALVSADGTSTLALQDARLHVKLVRRDNQGFPRRHDWKKHFAITHPYARGKIQDPYRHLMIY